VFLPFFFSIPAFYSDFESTSRPLRSWCPGRQSSRGASARHASASSQFPWQWGYGHVLDFGHHLIDAVAKRGDFDVSDIDARYHFGKNHVELECALRLLIEPLAGRWAARGVFLPAADLDLTELRMFKGCPVDEEVAAEVLVIPVCAVEGRRTTPPEER
jgi:hypothetical protein